MKRTETLLLLTVALLVCLSGIWVFPLHEPDEGRYADIALRMAHSGDWLTPRLNGIRYFEKPPLFFWLAALSIRLFGASEFAVRLPSVLAALLTLAFTLSLANRLFGARTARLAFLLLLTAPLFVVFAKLALVEMVLAACFTSAVGSVFEAALSNREPSRKQAVGFWGFSACACLCKGPIGLVLPMLGFILFAALTRRWAFVRGLVLNPLGVAVFGLVAGPWFVLMESQNPGYLGTFLVEQNLGRMFSNEHFQRFRPVWYYIPALAALIFPWTLFLPDAIVRFTKSFAACRRPLAQPEVRESQSRILLNCLWIGPFLLFSFAQSKVSYYLLALFPPLCILLADGLGERPLSTFRRRFRALGMVCFFTTGVLLIASYQAAQTGAWLIRALADPVDPETIEERVEMLLATAPYIATALAFIGLSCIWSSRRQKPGRARSLEPVIASLVIVICVFPWIAGRLGPLFSAKRIAIAVQDKSEAAGKFVFFRHYFRTVPFYVQRSGILWYTTWDEFGRTPDAEELARFSLQRRPDALRQLWAGNDRTVAIISGSEELRDFYSITSSLDSRVLGKFGQVVVLENRPAVAGCRLPVTSCQLPATSHLLPDPTR